MRGARRRLRSTVVFLGPTLPHPAAARLLPGDIRPPAALGDVYAATERGARTIVLIDGFFERAPAVWHKELLFALSRGVTVWGAASMGALRAAELDRFGMIGVGEVYRQFRTGVLERDDEVAVLHEPALGGFRPISEALVNIRATLAAAVRDGVLEPADAVALTRLAEETFYPDRSYELLLRAAEELGVPAGRVERWCAWLPRGAVNQKRLDAVAALTAASSGGARPGATSPFQQTWIWRDLIVHPVRTGSRPGPGTEEHHG